MESPPATGSRHLLLPPAITLAGVRRRLVRWPVALSIVALALAIALITRFLLLAGGAAGSRGGVTADAAAGRDLPGALPDLPPPDLLRALTPQEAQAANADRPVIGQPEHPAAPFRLTGDEASRLRAVDCLTQAIYYEAASEGLDGARAVAQVVLNRTRHPGYPNSVCGVVYQESMRATGCQFSFTCDGSLARVPVAYIWARSRLVANEALAGRVFAPVGYATHYHADYVLPYWADSLDKIAVIGRHIFYRFPGRTGSRTAFVQRYASREPPPPPLVPGLAEQEPDALNPNAPVETAQDVPKLEADWVKGLDVAKADIQENSPLQADLTRGQLILGEPSPVTKPKAKSSGGCQRSGGGRIEPLGAQDLKVGLSKGC